MAHRSTRADKSSLPLPLFRLFSPQIPAICRRESWWRMALNGATLSFGAIFLAFPVFLASLAGEEHSAVAGSCWEDENKGNFYW